MKTRKKYNFYKEDEEEIDISSIQEEIITMMFPDEDARLEYEEEGYEGPDD